MTMKDSSNRSYTDHTESTNCSYSCRVDTALEELAATFQSELLESGVVKDHKTSFARRVHNAFTGKDAVSVLHSLMPHMASREEALEKGNEFMVEYRLMRHVADKDKPLVDSTTDLYQLDQNLPSQVQRVKELYSSYWDKAWLIEQHIECKDRRHKFKTYPDCFVASECVDTLMHLKLVKSRKEAVFLMRKLIEKVFFCEPASASTEFKDDGEFFYVVPKNKRIQEPPKRHQKKKKGEDASHNSNSRSIKTSRSSRTSASVRSRAESVRSGFVKLRESQSHADPQHVHFPVNAPRG